MTDDDPPYKEALLMATSIRDDITMAIRRLTAQHDRLLAAAESALVRLEHHALLDDNVRLRDTLTKLRNAIAYAKGASLCDLCHQPVGDEWRGHYVTPTHLDCAQKAGSDG